MLLIPLLWGYNLGQCEIDASWGNSPSIGGWTVWPRVIQHKERNLTKYWHLKFKHGLGQTQKRASSGSFSLSKVNLILSEIKLTMWKERLHKICTLSIPLFKTHLVLLRTKCFLSFSGCVFHKIVQNVLNNIFTEFKIFRWFSRDTFLCHTFRGSNISSCW